MDKGAHIDPNQIQAERLSPRLSAGRPIRTLMKLSSNTRDRVRRGVYNTLDPHADKRDFTGCL